MRSASLIKLLAAVSAVTLLAQAESVEAQRGRKQTERAGRVQPALKDIPLPTRPTDPPKAAPKAAADEKSPEAKAKGGKNQDGKDEAAEPPAPDEWPQEEIARALRDCVRLLAPIAAEVDVTVPIKNDACGTPAPVLLRKIGTSNPVTLSPPATINCPMVAALHRWVETRLQPEARRLLGSPIVSLGNVSGYSCRLRNGSRIRKLSEHALANAIDIGRFETADGQTITLTGDWGPTQREIKQSAAEVREEESSDAKGQKAKSVEPPAHRAEPRRKSVRKSRAARLKDIPLPERRPDPTAEPARSQEAVKATKRVAGKAVQTLKPAASKQAEFLKKLHEDACGIFGTVLGPEANDAHLDHFHFDLATRRHRAYCE